MQQETGDPRNASSPILPLVVAAFAGATLAIACERPDTRAAASMPAHESAPAQRQSAVTPLPQGATAQAPAAPLSARDPITDTMITGRIKGEILTDPALGGADISVNTDHGVVILTGNVKSAEQTGIASAHAQRQDGVMRVDNHLSMNPQ